MVSPVAADLAAVGMLLVAPRHARQGVGLQLMRHTLQVAAGATVFLYATAVGLPLYTKLGFRTVDEVFSHIGPYQRVSARVRGDAVREARSDDLTAIAELDGRAFGADRSHVLRRMLDFSERVVIVPGRGYAAGWRNRDRFQVGPLVAGESDIAIALLEAVLRDADGAARIDLHSTAPAAVRQWVAERGLREQAPAPLMVFGHATLPGARDALLSPLMQALG